MAAGLQAMHQNSFVHRDFAARNCLVSADMTVKVGDYGLSEELYKDDYFEYNDDALPIRWLAPESVQLTEDSSVFLRNITRESNLWSFGVALWEVFSCGAMPYGDLSNDQVLRLVIEEGSVRLPLPDLPISNADRLYQLMQMCWNPSPGQRASLRELRIMLLHLRSLVQGDPDTSAFDQKWNQLMPRRLPPTSGTVVASQQPPASVSGTGNIQSISANVIDVDLGTFTGQVHHRTNGSSFGNHDLTELNALMLVHPSSLQQSGTANLDDGSGVGGGFNAAIPRDTGIPRTVVHGPAAVSSPVNEMSLAAELGVFGTKQPFGAVDSDSDDTGDNNLTGFDGTAAGQFEMDRDGMPQRLSVHAEVHSENVFATEYMEDNDVEAANSNTSSSKLSSSYSDLLVTVAGSMTRVSDSASTTQSALEAQKKYAAYLQTVSTSVVEGDDDFFPGTTGEQVSPSDILHEVASVGNTKSETLPGDLPAFSRYDNNHSDYAEAVSRDNKTGFAQGYREQVMNNQSNNDELADTTNIANNT
jgi:serine/threonine protein kinase